MVGTPPPGASAAYYPNRNRIVVTALPDPDDVVHEMVHAFNDHISHITKDRPDEGMAYATEQIIQGPLWSARTLEDVIKKSNPIVSRRVVAEFWTGLWNKYGSPSGYIGGSIHRKHPFKFNAQDFTNVKNQLGLHISCRELASAINSILLDKGSIYYVTCSPVCTSPEALEIGAGATIDPVFQ